MPFGLTKLQAVSELAASVAEEAGGAKRHGLEAWVSILVVILTRVCFSFLLLLLFCVFLNQYFYRVY